MRRNDREIKDRLEIDSIISRARVCRLALCRDGQPYIVPLCFGYDGKSLYFHAAKEGMKIEALMKNSRVCFEMDIDQELVRSGNSCSMRYRSVIGFGRASFIEDAEGKRLAIEALMRHYEEDPLEWPQEALAKVAVIKVEIESLTGKRSGP
ncbi:MAG TPA: pyridoxamine 5'-phosphate oxidase family protein [Methanotrichaceae archaeon]|nr:pyridoxamine 5'-phosphate oxidase family protein [Methanotrichaceae archaeon]